MPHPPGMMHDSSTASALSALRCKPDHTFHQFPWFSTRPGERLPPFLDGAFLIVDTVGISERRSDELGDLQRLSPRLGRAKGWGRLSGRPCEGSALTAGNLTVSIVAWVRYLPEVHPFLLDTAQTVDRTIARFEGRIGVLQAELAQLSAALAVGEDSSGNRAARAKRAAYQQEIAEYQTTISQCRGPFEAQVAHRWTAAEISHAKSRAEGLCGEPAVTA